MDHPLAQSCTFDTSRLTVGEWHAIERERDSDLAHTVVRLLTPATTSTLPGQWRGDFSVERAIGWIDERDRESPTLLVLDQASRQPVGLVMLFESESAGGTIDLRIGYVIAESASGQGLATELVAGLADWARSHRQVRTLTGGVAPDNVASLRVLVKNGFLEVGQTDDGEAIYQLSMQAGTEWDRYADTWDHDEAAMAYAEAALDSLQDVLAEREVPLDGARVCDFGCGTGLLTERLAGTAAAIDAVDSSTAMLEVLQAKIDRLGWAHVRTATDIASAPASYDLVVCSSVCGFLYDYPATAGELTSILKPGGLFVQWDWERDEDDGDPPGLTRKAIREALTAAGLDGVSVTTGFEVSVGGRTMRPLMGVGQQPHQ